MNADNKIVEISDALIKKLYNDINLHSALTFLFVTTVNNFVIKDKCSSLKVKILNNSWFI